MKSFVVAVILLFAAPGVAHATPSIVARDLPLHGTRALAATTPQFDLVGLHWRGTGSVSFRTRSTSGVWSNWRAAAPEPEDGPDQPTLPGWRIGNPYWTGASDAIAYRTHGTVTRVRAFFVWSESDGLPLRRLSLSGSPPLISRRVWGADESIRRAAPRYATSVQFAVVHHTAGTNNYSPSQSAAIVRGIEVYHVKGNGWNDIGYNFLVDKYGQVFEGRYGGVDKNVIGAHAEGFNTGSVGVALLGTYNAGAPPAVARTALANLLAWRLDVAHVDPLSQVTIASGGNPKFAAGVPVLLRAVSGHRDTGPTTCPGNALYAQLGSIASAAAADGLPKLYSPTVNGQPGGTVEFRARLSTELPWTVTVTDASGNHVASGSGTSSDVYWVWDASKAPAGRYAWTISAGSDVRPATGFVGAAPVPLALKSVAVKPATVSTGQPAKISYTLTASATVTATLRDGDGKNLATLFSGKRSAGAQSFSFAADGVADGSYDIVLSASDGKKTVGATLPLTVDRTLVSLTTPTPAFSPNGDGRLDDATFAFQLARSAHVRADITQASRVQTTLLDADVPAGDQTIQWDGSVSGTRARDGTYAVTLTLTSAFGKTVHHVLVRLDTRPPVVRAISLSRRIFTLSETSRVELTVGAKKYARTYKRGVVRFALAGKVRSYRVRAIDAAGNVSRTLRFH